MTQSIASIWRAMGFKLGVTLIISFLLTTCNCNNELGCPEDFTVGDECEAEGMQCPWPYGKCGTICTCVNEPGAFRWDCRSNDCKCTCYCGLLAISSCETLECTTEADPCPENARSLCDLFCAKVNKDAGPDALSDGTSDISGEGSVARDGLGDGFADGVSDSTKKE